MRPSIVVVAGLVVVAGYIHGRSDSEPIGTHAAAATAEVRVVGPVRAAIPSPVHPTLVAPRVPVLDLIDPDQEPPLPAAPPRSVHGRLLDLEGESAVGATVVVTSPNLQGEQVVITDDNGYFRIVELPIGDYAMTIYYNNRTYRRSSLDVNDREAVAVEDVLDPSDSAPEIEVVTAGSESGYNIPVPGRTFTAVLGAAAGSQGDSYGVSITGVTSIDNVYVVDEATDEAQAEPSAPAEGDPTRLEARTDIVDRGGM
ncbi:MAG TPA: carboxypeptidase-like regulatory domain-containing protein [Kofleriaceae bacterium]|nr:carboxypeptidase-like regulatory domain-containing protein [Kofleriaceae bacterium]